MSSVFGENLKLSIFGQSHGAAMGMVLDGIPAGLAVDTALLQQFLNRRRPGTGPLSTSRQEADEPHFLSGIVDGFTCGAPIAATVENANARTGDYAALADTPRPGHADYPAHVKFGGFQDLRGGGHFSGRTTAPLCIAGGLCLQWLEQLDIRIGAHIIGIGGESAPRFDPLQPELGRIGQIFPTLSADAADHFRACILRAAEKGDSVGGRIECAVTGLPIGLGEPMFGGVENRISQAVFAIPAVKSIAFGDGVALASACGSAANDPYCIQNGRICTATNHCGGILGGLTTSMPLIFDVAVKPTPSVSLPQQTVSLSRMEETTLRISGRHDPCIVPRAVAAVEAAAAVAVFDLILGNLPAIGRK